MSQINVNRIKDSNEGAPDFPSGVNVGGITSTVTLGVTNLNPTNVNVSGVVTATTFDGTLLATGTPTLGVGVTINTSGLNISGVATAGIVSATTLYGDGSNLTGIALTIAPLNYNPAVLGSELGKNTGIGLTFNQAVKAGSGNVTLSIANAGVAGTVVENFGVGNSVTYGVSDYGTTITITPSSSLTAQETYHLSYPSGAFTTIGGDVSYVGTAYTFGIKKPAFQLWIWGSESGGSDDSNGSLGLNQEGDSVKYSSPVQLPGTTWSYVGGTGFASGVIRSDGTLWMMGRNDIGTLGQNDTTYRSSPVQVPGTTWSKIVSGHSKGTAAIKTDGTLWTWGENTQGYGGGFLGHNDRIAKSSPTQVPGTTWSAFDAYMSNMMLATKTDGTLWSWGYGENGALGHNQAGAIQLSSPTQIPGTNWGTSPDKIAVTAATSAFAIKTNGELWGWGTNPGSLGQNNKVKYSSPVQIPGTTWRNVAGAGSGSSVYATKTDGTLWAWGYQGYGELGQNNLTAYSSPVQIPGTTWVRALNNLNGSAGAVKTDGTLWMWGENEFGELGQNNRTKYSSPVQVPGFTVSTELGGIEAGRHSKVFALKEI